MLMWAMSERGIPRSYRMMEGFGEHTFRLVNEAGEPVAVDLALATHIASVLEGHPDNASASVLGGLTVSWMPDGSGLDRGDRTVTASIALHPEVEVPCSCTP